MLPREWAEDIRREQLANAAARGFQFLAITALVVTIVCLVLGIGPFGLVPW